MPTEKKTVEYSLRKHRSGWTISRGNIDKDWNYLPDGSYEDIVSGTDRQSALGHALLDMLRIGEITINGNRI